MLRKTAFLLIAIFSLIQRDAHCFEKVVIWGYKLDTHTHSYIHNAFYRAFSHLGYPTYWFDDTDDLSNFDFSKCLFLTAGASGGRIPVRKDCQYILHNVTVDKLLSLGDKQRLYLQVFTKDVFLKPQCKKIDTCIYFDPSERTLYMPWATDLLPHEIDEVKKHVNLESRQRTVYWIGTIGMAGDFPNFQQISPFITACHEQGVEFVQYGIYSHNPRPITIQENQMLIASSFMAPAIVGQWQCEKGYIPCRIFKNISYGHMGVTNSEMVYELFERRIVYNPDSYQLFYDAKRKLETMTIDELYGLMDFVKEKHTYLNRIELLLWALQQPLEMRRD